MTSESTDTRRSRKGLIVTLALAAVIIVFSLCTYQVRETEVALISTFGRLNPQPHTAGLHWKMPWPFQKVMTFDTSLQLFEGKFEENYTADEKSLILTIFGTWSVDDPVRFHNSLKTVEEANAKLADIVRTEKGYVISNHPVSHLISTDPEERKFEEVEAEIKARVQAAIDKGEYGIKLVSLGIEQINLPPQITQDVFQRMARERTNKADKIRQEGVLAAGRIRADGRVKSGEIEAEAKEKAKTIRSEGDLAAAEKYEVFEQDKEFAVFLRQLESLETIMSKKTTLVIDRDVPPFSLLKGEFLEEDSKATAED